MKAKDLWAILADAPEDARLVLATEAGEFDITSVQHFAQLIVIEIDEPLFDDDGSEEIEKLNAQAENAEGEIDSLRRQLECDE